MSRHPVIPRAAIVAAVALAAAILGRYGVDLPPEVQEPLVDALVVAAPLAVAWWVHRHAAKAAATETPDARPSDSH